MSVVVQTYERAALGFRKALPLVMALWLLLWLNIGSGYWHLSDPEGIRGWFHALRAVYPFLGAVLAVGVVRQWRARFRFSRSGPVSLMAVYGVVVLAASVLSVAPLEASYWGGLYICVFIVLQAVMAGGDPMDRGTQLLALTWLIVAACAVLLTVLGRSFLFGREGQVFSGHGITTEISDVGGFAVSRSTGIGRFAGVAAVVAFVKLTHGRRQSRLLWAAVGCGFAVVALATQARTAMFGIVAAVAFVLTLQRNKLWLCLLAGLVVLGVLGGFAMPEAVEQSVLKRGQDENLMNMSGRPEYWKRGWDIFLTSPVLGLGPLADRFHMEWSHIHNAWLMALMQAGVVGTGFFVAAWLVAWRLFYRSLRKVTKLPASQKRILVEAGAVLAFFTLRSITETTAAAISADLLIIVPILVYLEVLDRRLSMIESRNVAVAHRRAPVPVPALHSTPYPVREGRNAPRG